MFSCRLVYVSVRLSMVDGEASATPMRECSYCCRVYARRLVCPPAGATSGGERTTTSPLVEGGDDDEAPLGSGDDALLGEGPQEARRRTCHTQWTPVIDDDDDLSEREVDGEEREFVSVCVVARSEQRARPQRAA